MAKETIQLKESFIKYQFNILKESDNSYKAVQAFALYGGYAYLSRQFVCSMKTKILWIFTIIFTMITVNSCSVQKKLNEVQPSQDDIQNKEFTPYISMAAVKEGTTTCYRDGSNLMCRNGTNAPVPIVKNIKGQFMLFNQCVYYFTHNLDLHKIDINSQEDTLVSHHINASFVGAYKNSIYLCSSNHTGIIMITENKSRELYKVESTPFIHFTTILKDQLFIVADIPDKEKSNSSLSDDSQIIYKIDLNKKEKSLETITTCKLPRLTYTEYIQNAVLADDNAIYCLNMTDHWKHSSFVKEVEIIRIDKTGTTESLIKKKEPIGLSFLIDGTIVYYCCQKQIYEQIGQKFFDLGNGENVKKILYYEKKCYWYESDADDGFGTIYCYDGQNIFPLIEINSFIRDIAIIEQTLYYCIDLNFENSEEIGYFITL